jgi:heat shock protein HtpX
LEKISKYEMTTKTATQEVAPLYFTNPFKEGKWATLLSTHPPIEERIKRLREM